MTNPTPTDGTRWAGFSHEDLYKMLHDGPGASASAEPSRRWAEVAATLTEISQDLKKAIDLTGAGWTGRAAGAAYERLATTVDWASVTGTSAAGMRVSVEDQAGHIARARAEMPAPEGVPPAAPDPTIAPAVTVLQTQTDAEPVEEAAASAQEKAVAVMVAYEKDTNATTAALATFTSPEPLLPDTKIHHGKGGGLLGLGQTIVAGVFGGGHKDDRHDDNRGGKGGGRGDNHGTHGSSSTLLEDGPKRRVPTPGRMTALTNEPLVLGPGGAGAGKPQESTPKRGNVVGSNPGSNNAPGPQKPTGNLPPHELQQAQQAAAAGQAAAGTHPGAGAPIAPSAGAPLAPQEKLVMRRFGMDAIGSSQWFGDAEDPVPGEAPKRRFDLRETVEVTESVSILDEEHKLPPNVIGEGGR